MLLYGVAATALVALGWALGDTTWWSFGANLTAFYWLAPSVVFAVVALLCRWWAVAVACTVGAVVWLATFGPMFVPQHTVAADPLRVVSYNISPQPRVDHVARLVERTHPDVLLVQEVLPEEQDDLVRLLPSLPHHHFAPVNTAAPGGGGTAVLSRLPVVDAQPVGGLPSSSRPTAVVTLDTGSGVVHVVSLHLTSPCATCADDDAPQTPPEALEHEAGVRGVEAERVADALPSGPVLVGGDLNSSTLNTPRRRLLAHGLVDLHRVAGAGPGFTRSVRRARFRIDWLLASRDVIPVHEWVDVQRGSDHRPVVADVQLPPS
jgi:endonuclease/exonuclease/phosphatase (EEP) superfamily protein YafD